MNVAAAILLLACSGPKASAALADWAPPQVFLTAPALLDPMSAGALLGAGAGEPWRAPPCIGNTCQPRVSIPVPGFETRIDMRGTGAAVIASTLERANAGVLATVARAMATSGVRLEYQPPLGQDALPKHSNLGALSVMVRWRLDAWNGPVFQTSGSR
jgi:hypothetical protein